MRKRIILFLEIAVALMALVAGYFFIAGKTAIDTPVAARSVTTPESPHVLYLAPEGTERGKVIDEVMQNLGAVLVRSWQEARVAAESQALDGLLIDATFLEAVDDSNRQWFQSQFRNGVAIVGLGVEEDKLAQALGLKTLRSFGEGDIPIGQTGYIMVSSLVLGQSDDVAKLEQADWLDQAISSDGVTDKPAVDGINQLAVTSFSKSRGELTSDEALDELLIRLQLSIEGAYQTRIEYQKEFENSEEK